VALALSLSVALAMPSPSSYAPDQYVVFRFKTRGPAGRVVRRAVRGLESLGARARAGDIGDALPKRAAELLESSGLKKLLSGSTVDEIRPLFRRLPLQHSATSLTSLAETVDETSPESLQGYNVLKFKTVRAARLALKVLKADGMIDEDSVHVPAMRHYAVDPRVGEQWSLRQMRVPDAEALNHNGIYRAVPVTVIDGGVDDRHPDLEGVAVAVNFVPGTASPVDNDGHGTHCAGIVAAKGDNDVGIRGVCRPAELLCLKAFGPFDAPAYYEALRFAVERMQRGVISLSISGTAFDPTERDLLQMAVSSGCVVAAAMGNRGTSEPEFPARLSREIEGIIAVGASRDDDNAWPLSNTGDHLDLLAPGVDVLSTIPHQFRPGDPFAPNTGTSMAVPHVAAAAAILMHRSPASTPAQVRAALRSGARRLAGDSSHLHGSGRLDLNTALSLI
jgi:thermitase